ncbi:hypothetical protein LTR08_006522 [Meristemomyces frigidus]|nr:hypothetical protein LTR08_006522 [Meristemomyces frigidus]
MPWAHWLSPRHAQDADDKKSAWSRYTTTQTITACILTAAATLALERLYKTYLRRIPSVDYLKPGLFRQRSLYGYVTSVGDGDNFRLFHTPGGRLFGWGWFPGRRVGDVKQLKGQTVHVRIAGVDAPELAHFGNPAQPYGKEALEWLRSFVLHRYVRAYPYRRDRFDRVVCTVSRTRWLFFNTDVGHNMLKNGMATVYTAKDGSEEFGSRERQYRGAEARAKEKKIGMWHKPSLVGKLLGRQESVESPREYKTRIIKQERQAKSG